MVLKTFFFFVFVFSTTTTTTTLAEAKVHKVTKFSSPAEFVDNFGAKNVPVVISGQLSEMFTGFDMTAVALSTSGVAAISVSNLDGVLETTIMKFFEHPTRDQCCKNFLECVNALLTKNLWRPWMHQLGAWVLNPRCWIGTNGTWPLRLIHASWVRHVRLWQMVAFPQR